MSIIEIIVVFFTAWWIIFLIVLPIGSAPSQKPEKGHDPGAPDKTHLLKKFIGTTLLTTIATAGFYWYTIS
jgi:predicted secreted protein